jgi:hypothetical protein
VRGTYYCRGSAVFQVDHYVIWVSEEKAPAVTLDELATGRALHEALRDGPLNVAGTFPAVVAPVFSAKKGDEIRLYKDSNGFIAVPK